MNSLKPIIFKIGEETKPVVVGLDNYKDSLLGEQIDHAYKCFLTMVKECSLNPEGEESLLFCSYVFVPQRRPKDYYNL